MIVSSAPFRVSFVGGGTDLPEVCHHIKGGVVSCAINKRMHIAINERYEDDIYLMWREGSETASSPSKLSHGLISSILEMYTVPLMSGVEIATMADLPGRGSGLGSSSSLVVASLAGLEAWTHYHNTRDLRENRYFDFKYWLGETAYRIERVGTTLGRQDQFAAAYGGGNHFVFSGDNVEVNQIPIGSFHRFFKWLTFIWLGESDQTKPILSSMSSTAKQKLGVYREQAKLVEPFKNALLIGNFKECGEIIREGWEAKKCFSSGIETGQIRSIIDELGDVVIGAKVLGSGGGGVLMVCHKPDTKEEILQFVRSKNLRTMYVEPDSRGVVTTYAS